MSDTIQDCAIACATPTALLERVKDCIDACVDEKTQEAANDAIISEQKRVCYNLANKLEQSAYDNVTDYKTRFNNLLLARKTFLSEAPSYCRDLGYSGDSFIHEANNLTVEELGYSTFTERLSAVAAGAVAVVGLLVFSSYAIAGATVFLGGVSASATSCHTAIELQEMSAHNVPLIYSHYSRIHPMK